MSDRFTILQLSEDDRPREKLRDHGVEALSDAELLAILVGSGNTEMNAVQLMQKILKDCDNQISRLSRMQVADLCAYKGVGEAKAISILAACELGRRRIKEEARERFEANDSATVADYLRPHLRDLAHEECWVLFLNQANREIMTKRISEGGLSATSVDVRRVLHEALRCDATRFILCHNHPSGNPHPSGEDDKITERLRKAADIMGITMLDHIIIADDKDYSYRNEGKL